MNYTRYFNPRSEYDDVVCQNCDDVYEAGAMTVIDTLPYCPTCAPLYCNRCSDVTVRYCQECGEVLDFCEHFERELRTVEKEAETAMASFERAREQ